LETQGLECRDSLCLCANASLKYWDTTANTCLARLAVNSTCTGNIQCLQSQGLECIGRCICSDFAWAILHSILFSLNFCLLYFKFFVFVINFIIVFGLLHRIYVFRVVYSKVYARLIKNVFSFIDYIANLKEQTFLEAVNVLNKR